MTANTLLPSAIRHPSFLTESVKGLQHADMKAWITREGAEPAGGSTAEFAKFFRSEIEKFARIVKASGAKPDS